ncbi:MAG: zinc-finger domain-containing protein [Gammaproteobacteria bacterium]|nr:zinc-finger domain-containing protein [Gammaproteobacteria bacterium]
METDKQACTKRRYEISHQDLPLSCPPRDRRIWDAHPRVYLPIEELGSVVCPYCGAEYVLQGFKPLEK